MSVAWKDTSERHHCVKEPLYHSTEDSCAMEVVVDMDAVVELADHHNAVIVCTIPTVRNLIPMYDISLVFTQCDPIFFNSNNVVA